MTVEFPVLDRFAYLNAGTFGPMSRGTLEAMAARSEYDQAKGRGGKEWFEDVLSLRQRVRSELATLIGANDANVALTHATTDGCNIVLAGLGLGRQDEVVTTNAEHPGLLAPLHATGARVRVAEVTTRPTAEALDAVVAQVTPHTRLLALSHVIWTTGQVMPVHELRDATGLPVLVDGAQSVGAIAVNVGELDYYTVSCQKWLCAPEPTGALYVREPDSLPVAIPTYFSQQSIERDGAFVPRDGASRFDLGWIASPALAGLEQALAEAPADRFERARCAAQRCRALLRERGYNVAGDGDATLVAFEAPTDDPAGDAARLYDLGVIVRDLPRTGWLRASCGWWTTEEHLARLVDGLDAIRRGG